MTDASGVPTSPDNIPTFNTSADAPSGLGFNTAMAQLQAIITNIKAGTLASGKILPAGISWTGAYPFVNADCAAGMNLAVSKLAPGANTQVLTTTGGVAVWAAPAAGISPGTELDYVQITANVNPTHTTEATADAVITGNSVTYDGTKNRIEFFSPSVYNGSAGSAITIVLLRDSTVLGRISWNNAAAAAVDSGAQTAVVFDTPAAGAHVYKVQAFVGSITGTPFVGAGLGGAGNFLPAFIRVTKA